jgi:hypothetical protein
MPSADAVGWLSRKESPKGSFPLMLLSIRGSTEGQPDNPTEFGYHCQSQPYPNQEIVLFPLSYDEIPTMDRVLGEHPGFLIRDPLPVDR